MSGPKPGAPEGTTSTRDTQQWHERSACRTTDPNLFHAPDEERKTARAIREAQAKAICHTCPVQLECLREATDNALTGIWGGTNDEERENSRKARSARANAHRKPPTHRVGCGTPSGSRNHYKHGEQACEDCLTARRTSRRTEPAGEAGQDAANAARRANALKGRAQLAAEVEHLIQQGADLYQAALATNRSPETLERALYRCERPDLIARLKRAA